MTAPDLPTALSQARARALAAVNASSPADLRPLPPGADNLPFAFTAPDGTKLVVKVPRPGRIARYATAAWASTQLHTMGVPVPRVLWYDHGSCVETWCPGGPLDRAPDGGDAVAAAERVGATLRRIHQITVSGFGRLDASGCGQHSSIRSWLGAASTAAIPATLPSDTADLLARSYRTLRWGARLLPATPPRLLHGDWAARHVLTDGQSITGVIDLESARGGDPLADLAGFSLQESAELTRALFAGYFDGKQPVKALMPLALCRLRIAVSLLRYHAACQDTALIGLRTAQIEAELDGLSGGLTLIPRITQGN
ncbi:MULTISPECIES: phosphotransferase family protein [unclassified Kitasatospora]|uniref:phosphotransferase family protein n=1 Tax=unclassified Kitasatospora TaxID=2633591 RepID=UPI00070D6A7D|nr:MULTISPECIES: aminoglycoside phosphotransferase family protein [unclassified Kitasatospora]KQV20878.1 hypothetical protein ASC99_20440 [Kitasatospora sp. Root107]KRB60468.1 hypothetical protein ASE03_12740 [Kitasatospora sp. Root187]